ncbi:MAG: sulfoxide reductase heme-binding subunit YedZ [Methylococcaceae bacterium]|nr:sulfoxide reductase heme-binding subunit YedZ [Methylococcaceae bacterium]
MNIKTLDNPVLAWIKAGIFGLALIPLIRLVSGAFLDTLGANPIEKITHGTGYWTLTFLLISLAITPFRRLLGWSWLIRLRRMLSLFAFFYASMHFLTYLVLDQFFDWPSILKDIAKRPYITVGVASFVLLIPLALTSTDGMIRRLGGRRWRRLHRWVYLIAVGGIAHYWWLVKKDISNPLIFASLLAVLLGLRLIHWARGLTSTGYPSREQSHCRIE